MSLKGWQYRAMLCAILRRNLVDVKKSDYCERIGSKWIPNPKAGRLISERMLIFVWRLDAVKCSSFLIFKKDCLFVPKDQRPHQFIVNIRQHCGVAFL